MRRLHFPTITMRGPIISAGWHRFSAAFISAIITSIIYRRERRGGHYRRRTENICENIRGVRQSECAGQDIDRHRDRYRDGDVRMVGA